MRIQKRITTTKMMMMMMMMLQRLSMTTMSRLPFASQQLQLQLFSEPQREGQGSRAVPLNPADSSSSSSTGGFTSFFLRLFFALGGFGGSSAAFAFGLSAFIVIITCWLLPSRRVGEVKRGTAAEGRNGRQELLLRKHATNRAFASVCQKRICRGRRRDIESSGGHASPSKNFLQV